MDAAPLRPIDAPVSPDAVRDFLKRLSSENVHVNLGDRVVELCVIFPDLSQPNICDVGVYELSNPLGGACIDLAEGVCKNALSGETFQFQGMPSLEDLVRFSLAGSKNSKPNPAIVGHAQEVQGAVAGALL